MHTSVNMSLFNQLLAAVGVLLITTSIFANPVLDNVAHGQVTFEPTSNTLTINQTSDKAIINWQSFNIGATETTHFNQPNGGIAFNRINAMNGASQIYGKLSATGQIILVNPAGIHFGSSARVNVGGLIVSTGNLSDQSFLSGQYHFTNAGSGFISNQGEIIATNNGLAALLGNNVSNEGLIEANLGKVVLASGDAFTLSFSGNDLISFTVNDSPKSVNNTGTLRASGGKIIVSAKTASGVLDNVINMDGITEAKSVGVQNGEIILGGSTSGVVAIKGKLIVSGKNSGERGGHVQITGRNILIDNTAEIDVRGDAGGGTIYIGGNAHGAGPLPNANATVVAPSAILSADAITSGNGGNIIIWADNNTGFYGAASARGGAESGNGGFVEVSGLNFLDFQGQVDTSAPHGLFGTLLLDPKNLIVVTAGGVAYNSGVNNLFTNNVGSTTRITPASINGQLSNVLLQANTDITFTNAIAMTTSGIGLTALAGRDIVVNADISTNNGNITLSANDASATASDRSAGTGDIRINANRIINAGSGNLSLTIGNSTTAPFSIGNIRIGNNSLLLSTGTVSLTSNTINFGNANVRIGANLAGTTLATNAIITPTSVGTTIGIAGGAGTLALTSANIQKVRATNVRIGSSTSGAITVNAWTPVATFAAGGTLTLASNGNITQGGVINLATSGAKLLLRGAGNVTLNSANVISNIAASKVSGSLSITNAATNPLTVTSLTDDLGTVNGITTPGAVTLTTSGTGGLLTLNQGINTSSGNSNIVLAGQSFTNTAGSAALNPGTGRYLVWSTDPASDTRGGLTFNFKQYNATFGSSSVLGTGNGFLYTVAPIITPSLTGSVAKVYDGTTTATLTSGNYSSTGAIDGDTVTLNNPTNGSYADKNAGVGKNVASSGITLATATNGAATVYGYTLGSSTANANIGTITPASLTVSSTAGASKIYGNDDPVSAKTAYSVTSGALFSGDSLTGNMGRVAGETVGSYNFTQNTVAVSDGNSGNNYALTFNGTNNPFQIIQRAPTGSIANQTKIYGDNDPALAGITVTLGNIVNRNITDINGNITNINDTSNVATTLASLTRNPGESVVTSPYAITTATFNPLTGSAAANYSAPTFTGAPVLNITQASLTVTANPASKTYGDADPTFTYSDNGLINRDVIDWMGNTTAINDQLTGSLSRIIGENVGTYPMTIGSLSAGLNYLINFTSSNLAITPATLIYVPDLTSRLYGSPNPALTGTVSGFVNGETIASATTGTLTFTSPASITSNVGNYLIQGSGLTANNGNYIFTQSFIGITALEITPASLTTSGITVNNKKFDATTIATLNFGSATLSGILFGDNVSINQSLYSANFISPNIGNDIPVTVTNLGLIGASAGNYQLVQPAGLTANIVSAGETSLNPSDISPIIQQPTIYPYNGMEYWPDFINNQNVIANLDTFMNNYDVNFYRLNMCSSLSTGKDRIYVNGTCISY